MTPAQLGKQPQRVVDRFSGRMRPSWTRMRVPQTVILTAVACCELLAAHALASFPDDEWLAPSNGHTAAGCRLSSDRVTSFRQDLWPYNAVPRHTEERKLVVKLHPLCGPVRGAYHAYAYRVCYHFSTVDMAAFAERARGWQQQHDLGGGGQRRFSILTGAGRPHTASTANAHD
jgi:hypothetical protein